MSLENLYTPKQIEVLKTVRSRPWHILINHGAVRTGKTVLDNDLFLMALMRVRKLADLDGEREPKYILAGVSSKTDRKSTRLNSSHVSISYAVFCLKKKKNKKNHHTTN